MEHVSKFIDELSKQEIKPIDTGIAYLDANIGRYYPGVMTGDSLDRLS